MNNIYGVTNFLGELNRNSTPQVYKEDKYGNIIGLNNSDNLLPNLNNFVGVPIFKPGDSLKQVNRGAGIEAPVLLEYVTINGERWAKVTAKAISGTSNYIELEFTIPNPVVADRVSIEFDIDNLSSITNFIPYFGNADWSVFANCNISTGTANGYSPRWHAGIKTIGIPSSTFAKTGYTRATNEQIWAQSKLRITVVNGSTAVIYLRAVNANTAADIGRLSVIADDGWASWFLAGAPILETYGIKTTAAIIPEQVGFPLTATREQLESYVSRGNSIVAHSNGNLFSDFSTTAARINEIKRSIGLLDSWGLLSDRGRRCYIFPQGQYSSAAGETTLLAAMQSEGILAARTAVPDSSLAYWLRGVIQTNWQKLLLPVVGHQYAGVINTADDATETTNINSIVTNIQNLSINQSDSTLMFHKVVNRGAAVDASCIETDRLHTIAAAIQTEVRGGKLRTVPFSEFV